MLIIKISYKHYNCNYFFTFNRPFTEIFIFVCFCIILIIIILILKNPHICSLCNFSLNYIFRKYVDSLFNFIYFPISNYVSDKHSVLYFRIFLLPDTIFQFLLCDFPATKYRIQITESYKTIFIQQRNNICSCRNGNFVFLSLI